MKTMTKTKTISGTKVLIALCLAIGFLAVANSFVPPVSICGKNGDVNGDGYTNYLDDTLITKMYVGTTPFDNRADLDCDGYIGPGDIGQMSILLANQGCVDSDGANFDQIGTVTINGQFFGTDE